MFTLTNLKIATLVSALAVTAIVSSADPVDARDRGGPARGLDFSTLDVDGNGEITESDLAALRENRFGEIDTNGDGSVTEDEFLARAAERAQERAAQMFERLDADGDGSISRDTLEAREGNGRGEGRLLRRADADGSGGVDEEEFAAAMERMAKRGERGERGRR